MKEHKIRGFVVDISQEAVYSYGDSTKNAGLKQKASAVIQQTIHPEAEHENLSIPLWLTPTLGGMLELRFPETGDHNPIFGVIEGINIEPTAQAPTIVHYQISVPGPCIDALFAVSHNQPTSATIIGYLDHEIIFKPADNPGSINAERKSEKKFSDIGT